MAKSTIKKTIEVAKNKFNLEIYLGLKDTIGWEIFPYDYSAALFAFSNKDRLNKVVENKYIYEAKK